MSKNNERKKTLPGTKLKPNRDREYETAFCKDECKIKVNKRGEVKIENCKDVLVDRGFLDFFSKFKNYFG